MSTALTAAEADELCASLRFIRAALSDESVASVALTLERAQLLAGIAANSTPATTIDHVWVANLIDEPDGLYVFESEDAAVRFAAARGAEVTEQPIILADSWIERDIILDAEEMA